MPSLSILPIEILEWITSVVTTSQQVRLWQCGDRILNIKFKNGGLKRTSLCWSGCSWIPWPRSYFTTYDGIVDVEWGMKFGESLCPTLELNLLPKTLKRLHLACDDVFILLRQRIVNMHDMLPTLQSLYLSGRHLREENLKNLPSNLIELYVASLGDEIESGHIFGDLPRHIARLTLRFTIVDESELENDLPSQLIFLDISRVFSYFNWFSKLPKSLKTLKISYDQLDLDWPPLPPQLEELYWEPSVFYGMSSAGPRFPTTLKTLEMLSASSLTGGELIRLLPKNLTRFVLRWYEIDHSQLQQLPASLIDFDGIVSATHPDLLSYYPPETIRIRIGDGAFSDNLNIVSFPTKLQFLELCHINDDICAMLPPCLKSLKIVGGGLITSKGASQLPKSLTSLTASLDLFDDNESMSYLRHIPNLELTRKQEIVLGKLNEEWIYSLLPSSSSPTSSIDKRVPTGTNLNDINPYLTSLRVSVDEHANIRPSIKKHFFDALPRFKNLKKLEIQDFSDISSDWLCLVPQSVTDLKIGHLNAYPSAAQLSMLPKCLRYLHLATEDESQDCEWNEETIQSLPRMLLVFSFNGRFPNMTRYVLQYLPPNLKTNIINPNTNSRIVEPLNILYDLYGVS